MSASTQPTARAPNISGLTVAIGEYANQQSRMIYLALGTSDLDEPTRQAFEYILRNVKAIQRATERLTK
jgi:hypothetical protein